jgi:hypothetical protein
MHSKDLERYINALPRPKNIERPLATVEGVGVGRHLEVRNRRRALGKAI